MGFDFDKGREARDRRLRRAMLDALQASRGQRLAGIRGRMLVDVMPAGGVEDDAHAMGLIRDLVNKGLADAKDLTIRRGQTYGPDYVFVSITDRGSRLLRGGIEADPDVDDERLAAGVE